MKKIAVVTWVTDDYVDYIGLKELKNSFKYFHPDVDFFVFDTAMTNKAKENNPWLDNVWMKPPCAAPYKDDYDMVVQIDGDCVVTGPMNELFESDEDVIGVRNNNSFNKAGSHDGITIRHIEPFGDGSPIPMQGFVNAGLVGVNNKEFWDDWSDVNMQSAKIKAKVDPYAHGIGDENDTLNQLFHCDEYTSKIVDEQGSGVSYGLSSCWGDDPNNHWESWLSMYVKDDRLYLDDPVTNESMCIKVLHQAGGGLAGRLNKEAGGFRNWLSSVVTDEVNDYLNEVMK